MSDSVGPHRQQPTRLPRPWDSPGKNTGVGCHFLLQVFGYRNAQIQGFPLIEKECLSTISNIFESQQLFSKRGVHFFFVSNWITNYCIFLTIVLNFYLRFSVSEKQTWWIEIKDNLLQCLLSCAERSSVIVIYSSCQEKIHHRWH